MTKAENIQNHQDLFQLYLIEYTKFFPPFSSLTFYYLQQKMSESALSILLEISIGIEPGLFFTIFASI